MGTGPTAAPKMIVRAAALSQLTGKDQRDKTEARQRAATATLRKMIEPFMTKEEEAVAKADQAMQGVQGALNRANAAVYCKPNDPTGNHSHIISIIKNAYFFLTQGPVLVLGDFNTTDEQYQVEFERLVRDTGLVDLHSRECGTFSGPQGKSYPDHILMLPALVNKDTVYWVHQSINAGSNHRLATVKAKFHTEMAEPWGQKEGHKVNWTSAYNTKYLNNLQAIGENYLQYGRAPRDRQTARRLARDITRTMSAVALKPAVMIIKATVIPGLTYSLSLSALTKQDGQNIGTFMQTIATALLGEVASTAPMWWLVDELNLQDPLLMVGASDACELAKAIEGTSGHLVQAILQVDEIFVNHTSWD